MNILVIGNGFDLAHELPTKYTDFLEFIKAIKQALGKGKLAGIDWGNTDVGVKNLLIHDKGNVQRNLFSDEHKNIWKDLINNNIWVDYFLNNSMYKRDNWIDFESEVSNIIQSLDNDMKSNDESLDDSVLQCSNSFLNKRFCSYIDEMKPIMHTYRMIRDELLNGLNKLIRAFEIYLTEYVEKIDIRKKSPNIEKLEIDHVLSFNYTDTYEKVYGISKEIEYDYIHGKADVIKDSNNMVLGIDEYLENNRKNRDIEFIEFKKYYQRIYKQTGCRYKEWIDEIVREYLINSKTEEKLEKLMLYAWGRGDMEKFGNFMGLRHLNYDGKIKIHNLYIFGHSLDVTDKDILCDLILNDNVYTTIYYPNKEELGRKITNLVKIIGQDELIRRTGGSTKTISFELQEDMTGINS